MELDHAEDTSDRNRRPEPNTMREPGERGRGGQEGGDPCRSAEPGEAERSDRRGARQGDFAEGAGNEAPIPTDRECGFVGPTLQREVKPGGQRSKWRHQRCGELRDEEVAVVAVLAVGVFVNEHDGMFFRFEQLEHASRDEDVTGSTGQCERERIVAVGNPDR